METGLSFHEGSLKCPRMTADAVTIGGRMVPLTEGPPPHHRPPERASISVTASVYSQCHGS